jgi:hypothetical protein
MDSQHPIDGLGSVGGADAIVCTANIADQRRRGAAVGSGSHAKPE